MELLQITADLSVKNEENSLSVKNDKNGSLVIELSGPSLLNQVPGSPKVYWQILKQYSRPVKNPIVVKLNGKRLLRARQGKVNILNWPLALKTLLKNWLNF